MQSNHFYHQYPLEKKREIRKAINKSIELRKRQREIFENAFIRPLTKQIELANKALKNEISLEHFVKEQKRWKEYLEKWEMLVNSKN